MNILNKKSDKLKTLDTAFRNWASDFHNGEILFLLGFAVYMLRCIMLTTMFYFPEILAAACLGIAVLFIGLKIFLFDTYTGKMLFIIIAILLCTGLICISNGRFSELPVWVLITIGAKDISFNKILQVYLLLNASIFILTFCASLMNIIENLVYDAGDRGLRNSFGYVYTTDFAAHVFFFILTAFYLGRSHLKWFYYVLICVLSGTIFYFCNTKLDTTCIYITAALFGIHNILKKQAIQEQPDQTACGLKNDLQEINYFKWTRTYFHWKKVCAYIGICIMPVLAITAFLLSYYYTPNNEIFANINTFTTGRLALSNMGLEKYAIKLFGQDVPMVGLGGSTEMPKDYFFLDCSYINMLLRYGIIFLIFTLVTYSYICIKNKDNTELLFLIIILAISSIIDHHLLNIAYNPFGFALFANTKIKQLKI